MRLTPDESPGGSLSDQRLLANSLRHLRRALIDPDDSVRAAALNVAFVRWQVENICCSVIEERCGRDEGAWNIASIRIIAAFRLVDRALKRDALAPEERFGIFHSNQRDLRWLRDTLPFVGPSDFD